MYSLSRGPIFWFGLSREFNPIFIHKMRNKMINEIYDNVMNGDVSSVCSLMSHLRETGEWKQFSGVERDRFRYLLHLWKTLMGQDKLTVQLKYLTRSS